MDLADGLYDYGLSAVYANGMESMKALTQVEINTSGIEKEPNETLIPLHYSLSQNFPNPFNPTTQINYAIPEEAHVSLKIYNLQGNLIKTFIDREQEAAYYNLIWDGTNDNGDKVNSGVYIYRIIAGDYTATRRMVMLK